MLSASKLYSSLPTEERPSQSTPQRSLRQLLQAMSQEDQQAVRAVKRVHKNIEHAIHLISRQLSQGGRLFFVGAGTSGRLGVLEAAECPPTFGTPPSLVQAIIAGGRSAVFSPSEGAEDDGKQAASRIQKKVRASDIVIGITASGVTPFVEACLKRARCLQAKTILITCHPKTQIEADLQIKLSVGPEVLSGSTRLKSGTATKLVLNMLTLGSMSQLGRTYKDLMVNIRPTSKKLRLRAVRIIQTLSQCSQSQAARTLKQAHDEVKPAILMAKHNVSYKDAVTQLSRNKGSLQQCLDD